MKKRQKLTVNLPNLTPFVTLPRYQGKVLREIIDSGCEGINTLQLTEAGCINPAKAVSFLRKKGALIASELRDVEDSRGEIRPQIAHYKYCGWRFVTDLSHPTTNPDKESA